uniref:Uncharacterized protein n=1 Tax=Ciona intestinalis TaxID=7719 RepID=H2XQN2_CIOIN
MSILELGVPGCFNMADLVTLYVRTSCLFMDTKVRPSVVFEYSTN